MNRRKWQRGEGKAGCIFWGLIFLVGGIAAWQWIPPKIADMQLADYVDELAQIYPRKDGDWFRKSIYGRARELRIPLEEKQIKVDKTLQRVRVEFEYSIDMNFFITSFQWTFSHDIERDIFLIGALPPPVAPPRAA